MTLKDGQVGMLLKVEKVCDFPLKERLMTMGVVPGTKIKVLRTAPFGDPIAVHIRSYELAIRRQDAAFIEVSEIS